MNARVALLAALLTLTPIALADTAAAQPTQAVTIEARPGVVLVLDYFGSMAHVLVSVRNGGDETLDLDVRGSASGGWTVEPGHGPSSPVHLAPGEDAHVEFNVFSPRDRGGASETLVEFTAAPAGAQHGVPARAVTRARIDPEGARHLDVELRNQAMQTVTGGEVASLDFVVVNLLDRSRVITFEGVVPQASNARLDPERVTLEPHGGSARVSLVFQAPSPPEGYNGWDVRTVLVAEDAATGAGVAFAVTAVYVDRPQAPFESALMALGQWVDSHPGQASALALAVLGSVIAAAALHPRVRPSAWWRLAPLLGLFTRLNKPQVLEHESRERILREVRARPGVSLTELQRATGLGLSTLVHHLRTLERHGLVVSRREGGRRRFHTPDAPRPRGPAVTPAQERILAALDDGPLGLRELAERLGVTRQAAHHHLKTLEALGLVAVERLPDQFRYARAGPASAPAPSGKNA